MTMDPRSEMSVVGVHPDLVRVVRRAYAATAQPFVVIEGIRSLKQEIANKAKGASTTLHSRHLDGHAVDVAALTNGRIDWNGALYKAIVEAMKAAALIERVPIECGYDWKTFPDLGHVQLPWAQYPAEAPDALKASMAA